MACLPHPLLVFGGFAGVLPVWNQGGLLLVDVLPPMEAGNRTCFWTSAPVHQALAAIVNIAIDDIPASR